MANAALAGLSLDRSDREPMHRQLAGALKRLILAQTLPSGSRLPASRSFAEELGVSRATVVAAVDCGLASTHAASFVIRRASACTPFGIVAENNSV